MVCHTLPPPVPPTPFEADHIMSTFNAARYPLSGLELSHELWEFAHKRGFTMVNSRVLLIRATNSVTSSYRGYVVRSVEEGWVLLDNWQTRWRPLGWLDSFTLAPLDYEEDSAKVLAGLLDNPSLWDDEGWNYGLNLRTVVAHPRFWKLQPYTSYWEVG